MKANGTLFWKDDYDTFYSVYWETINGVIDITSTISQPYVWGKPPAGHITSGILFRRGIITINRQVLRPLENGYEIVAEGASQYEGDVQMNYPCQRGPIDQFKYHLNQLVADSTQILVSDGSHWTDPDEESEDSIWSDLDISGSPVSTSATVLEFIDVWA